MARLALISSATVAENWLVASIRPSCFSLSVIAAHTLVRFFALMLGIWLLSTGCHRSNGLSKAPDHGVSIVVTYDANSATNAGAIIKQCLLRRADQFGTEAFVESVATNQLRISTPITDPKEIARLTNLFAIRGAFEIRTIHPQSERLIFEQKSAPGYQTLTLTRSIPKSVRMPYLVNILPAFSGAHIQRATVRTDSAARTAQIFLTFDDEGKKALERVTTANVGGQIAIMCDGQFMAAPRIAEPIRGGSATIDGNFEAGDALVLAIALESPLPFSVTARVEKTF